MITTLRKAFYKHGYLIIIAAWLFTISFIVANYWYYNSSPGKVKSRLEHKIAASERSFNAIVKDTSLLSSLISDTLTKGKKQLTEENYGVFIYTVNDIGNPILSYWNNNHFSVNADDLRREDSNYFLGCQSGQSELVKRTVTLPGQKGQKVIAAAVIPVYWDYFIQNKYLPKDFDGFPGLEEQYEISEDSTGLPVLNSMGQTLFKIRQKEGHSYAGYDMVTVFLRVVSMLLIVLFLNAVATEAAKEEGFKKVFLLLCTTVILLRFFTYILPFPFDFSRLSLFDPSIYASNFLHPSLGHLLINSVLAFWLISFYKINSFREPVRLPQSTRPWVKYINLFALVVVALVIAGIIRSLVQDSRISFDVTNFFSLINAYSVVSFIILCFLFLSFYYLSQVLLRSLIEARAEITYQLLVTAVSGLFILSFSIGRSSTNSNILLIAWLLLYVWLMNKRRHDLYVSLLKSSFFIFWAMFFAMSVASLVMYQNKVVELDKRKKKAEGLATQTDPSGESMLKIAVSTLNDYNISARSFYHLESEYYNKFFKDSLLNANFSGYLNKYETRIYTFNKYYKPLFNDDSTSYGIINNIINNPATQRNSSTDSLYTYQNTEGKISYLYGKVITQADSVLGYVYIISKPKRYKGESLSPELFKQVQDDDLNQEYASAVYINGKLVNKENDYGFPSRLNKEILPPALDYRQCDNDGYNELWYNDGNGRIVIVVKQNTLFLEAVTLFAYLFIIFLLVTCLYDMGSYLLQTRFQLEEMKQLLRFNIRTQIHATIIFISVFSFLVIGIATISFFIIRFKKNNLERLSNSIEIMNNEVEGRIKEVSSTDDEYTLDDVGFNSVNEKMITEISEIHNVDANLYSATGDLIATTEPYIYNKQLLSNRIDPKAYNELYYKKSIRFVQSEQLGNLQYLSIYVPVIEENGRTTAYLNIPYLNSQSELNQEISGFIATLINLNAFIFLLAGAIAFLLTNRIIASFSLIGDKMKEVGLGKVNEVIIWSRDDEIGALVNEYNKMVRKLEESARALAQNEREGAWREMARQVAHEIKNPLTPMKLSIQYLQKSIDSGAPNTKELSQRVAVTLVEQIDQLSQIASDFSQFANIGNVNLERFDISESIASVINLYKGNTDMEIEWKKTADGKVLADKIQMNRLFTNLVKNAIEATDENKHSHIVIEQTIRDNQVRILITDNGSGIPVPMREKIFAPNFTTKTSGTGLGLAICKGIVEKANGTISFTTEEGVGTTFVIELPING